MKTERDLLALAEILSPRMDHVQGAGGNISVKENDIMWIKASGMAFSEIASRRGFVQLLVDPVSTWFRNAGAPRDSGEKDSLQVIWDALLYSERDYKPSMETGFHAVLGRVVVHTHSVYANVLNCRENAEALFPELAKKFSAKAVFLPYYSPGYDLSRAVAGIASDRDVKILFLQSHGIIVHGDTIAEAMGYLQETDAVLQEYFHLKKFTSDGAVPAGGGLTSEYIFPDQVVYFSAEKKTDLQHLSEAQKELAMAYEYVCQGIAESGGRVQLMDPAEIAYITGMEMEKHRKKVNRIE